MGTRPMLWWLRRVTSGPKPVSHRCERIRINPIRCSGTLAALPHSRVSVGFARWATVLFARESIESIESIDRDWLDRLYYALHCIALRCIALQDSPSPTTHRSR